MKLISVVAVLLAFATGGMVYGQPQSLSGSGTAFIVYPRNLMLTAHHVVDRATSITVSCNGGPTVPAMVTSSSVTTDLAVLEASGDLGTDAFLRLSPQRVPSLGDRVFTIGYPTPDLLGTAPKYTNGTVSALSGLRDDASFLQISVPVQPGNSGGPLVNESGDVIGVVVATADAPTFIRATDSIPQNINWAVKTAFASVLFEPPSADSTPTADADSTIIDRVKAATCLVRVTVPVEEAETATASSNPAVEILARHRHGGWSLSEVTITLTPDALTMREFRYPRHSFSVHPREIRQINGSVWIDRGSLLTIHFRQKVNPGDKITINLSASSARQLYDYVSRYSPNAQIKDRP